MKIDIFISERMQIIQSIIKIGRVIIFMIKGIIFDFNQTLFDPEKDQLFPGVSEVLKELKERTLRLGLVSYGDQLRIRQIEGLGLLAIFDWSKVVFEKTAKDFEEFLSKFSLEKNEVLVVGDNPYEEIRIAKDLGLRSAWFNPKGRLTNQPTPADAEIENLSEIFSIL